MLLQHDLPALRLSNLACEGTVIRSYKRSLLVASCRFVFGRAPFSLTVITMAFKSVLAGLVVVLLLLELPLQSQGESTLAVATAMPTR